MSNSGPSRGPRFVRVFRQEGTARRTSPTGSVGRVFRGSGFEVVWVRKKGEEIDDRWFSQSGVDVLAVLTGRLKVEFPGTTRTRVLGPGDVMVLPPRARCRAYRWPRSSRRATIFLAIYPVTPRGSRTHR